MQSLFSFITDKALAVAKYEPQGVETIGDKLWFTYVNNAGSAVSAYYDFSSRSFKSVVRGKQYGKSGYAVRNLVARPVIEGALGEGVLGLAYSLALGNNLCNNFLRLGCQVQIRPPKGGLFCGCVSFLASPWVSSTCEKFADPATQVPDCQRVRTIFVFVKKKFAIRAEVVYIIGIVL